MAVDDRSQVSYSRVFRGTAVGAVGVLLVLLGAYGIYLIRSIVVLVVVALFLSVSLEPVVRRLTRMGMPRSTAVAVVFVLLVLLVAGFIWSLVPPIVEQGGHLIHNLPGYLAKLSADSKTVSRITDRYHLTERLTTAASALPGKLAGGAVGYFQRFFGVLASTFTVLVLTIYFTADMPRLRGLIVGMFPQRRRKRAGKIFDVMVDKVGGYMIGNIIISLIAGTGSFACMALLGIPYALPLGVVVAVTDLIPMIGATLGATICVVVAAFTVGIWPKALILVLYFILYQQAENYLLVPRIFKNTVDMSSAAVLLVALIGGTLLGLVGAVMAIPIAATIKVAVTTRGVPDPDEPPPDPAEPVQAQPDPAV